MNISDANTPELPLHTRSLKTILAIGFFAYIALHMWHWHIGHSIITSDLVEYIRWSYTLLKPSTWGDFTEVAHLPGLPIVIAMMRAVSLNRIDDYWLVMFLFLVLWQVSTYAAWRVCTHLCPESREFGTITFAFFPFVGLALAVNGRVDGFGYCFLMLAIWAGLERRWVKYLLACSIVLLLHKGFWPPMLFLSIFFCWKYGMQWWYVILSGVPLVAYTAWIGFIRGNFFWNTKGAVSFFVGKREETQILNRVYPVLDGILVSLTSGKPADIIQGLVTLGVFGCALALTGYFLRKRGWLELSLLVPLVILSLIVREIWVWTIMRFGPSIALPIAVFLVSRPALLQWINKRSVLLLYCAVLLLSQIAWVVYSSTYYSG